MLSLQKNFLFIHVPKTGGNSIQSVLKDYSEDKISVRRSHQDGVDRFDVFNTTYNLHKHTTIGKYKRILAPDVYRSLFKFSVIRNPWDAMISTYFFRQTGPWDRDRFAAMVRKKLVVRHRIRSRILPERVLQAVGLYRPLPLGRLDAELDYVMRFERLDEDFKIVCQRLGIPLVTLPHRNRSERDHYAHYYDEELKQLVARKHWDLIRFAGYTFEEMS